MPESSEKHLGEVGSPLAVVSVTPMITSGSAYSSGNAVGAAQKLLAACRVGGGKAVLESTVLTDKGNQKAALTILFFDGQPGSGTYTDKSALALATDLAIVVGKVNIAAADYETVDSKAVAVKTSVGLLMQASLMADLWVAVLTTGTPTYASTSDLTFKFGFLQG